MNQTFSFSVNRASEASPINERLREFESKKEKKKKKTTRNEKV